MKFPGNVGAPRDKSRGGRQRRGGSFWQILTQRKRRDWDLKPERKEEQQTDRVSKLNNETISK